MIGYIIDILKDGWKSINIEQKICLLGFFVGMILFVYFFLIFDKIGRFEIFRQIMVISSIMLSMFSSFLYSIFQYVPILKDSKNKIQNKITDFE